MLFLVSSLSFAASEMAEPEKSASQAVQSEQQKKQTLWARLGKRVGDCIVSEFLEAEHVLDPEQDNRFIIGQINQFFNALKQSFLDVSLKTILSKKIHGESLTVLESYYYKVFLDKTFMFGLGFGLAFGCILLLLALLRLVRRRK